MKSKRIIYILDFIILSPILVYLFFNKMLPPSLIIHFGPGAVQYTSTFNAMVLVPLLCLVLQQIIVYKPDWLGMPAKKKGLYYLLPILMVVFYFFSFLLSRS